MHKTHSTKEKCDHPGCKNLSISDAIQCWGHLHDKESYKAKLMESVNNGLDLSDYNLQKVDLREAHLEKANFTRANLSQTDMSEAHLFDAKLEGADLIGASLRNADLTHCDLRGADLTKASLNDSRLWSANMTGANLTECEMSGADLWNAKLFNVKVWHTVFKDAKSITKRSFSKNSQLYDTAKINESGILSAEESYRDLKGYFLSNGMYNDASWAAFNEKTMERKIFKKKKDLNYIPSLVMNILCGYGEKPYRIILSAFGAIMAFALLYAMLQSVQCSSSKDYVLRWSDYIYYSTITFTTVGYGDFIPRPNGFFRLLSASEAFCGIYLTGIFIFTLARKYSAR